jgi:hypothetical protein
MALPKRMAVRALVSFLRSRSAFWGDGLIVTAVLPEAR